MWKLAVDDVQVRPHTAQARTRIEPLRSHLRPGHLGGAQRLANRLKDHGAHCLAALEPREDMKGPGADDLREAPPLAGLDAALVAQGGQGRQARGAGLQDPRALGEVEPRHVLRELALSPGVLVRLPEVPADNRLLFPRCRPSSLSSSGAQDKCTGGRRLCMLQCAPFARIIS